MIMENLRTYPENIMPRVLIVDNDVDTRDSHFELLALWNYIPFKADGSGESLCKNAIYLAREKRCQIALVDLRLEDDNDVDDKSGLELIRQLDPAKCIVVTGYGNDQIAADILEESGAVAYVGKQYGPEILKQKIQRESQKICSAYHKVRVTPQAVLDYIANYFASEIPEEYIDQIGDILIRLFPRARELRIEKLGEKQRASSTDVTLRPRSVILKVYEDNRQPVIVKLARAHKIKIEADKFENLIDGHIVAHRHPRLERSEVLWDIGGALYSSLGLKDFRTFPSFYIESGIDKVTRSLEQFFAETWSSLYKETRKDVNTSLIDLYFKIWGNEWYSKRVAEFGEIGKDDPWIGTHLNEFGGIDPLSWLQHKIDSDNETILTSKQDIRVCVTHGDLHSGNLLVDQDDVSWVIDFERSGEGHILQDFVELETDLVIRLASHVQDVAEFYKLCLVIVRPYEIRKFRPSEISSSQNPEYLKMLHTISQLRFLAKKSTGVTDARQYLIGMLFNAIFRATLTSRDFRNTAQARALMLASIICHRLDHWEMPWPPDKWKKHILKSGGTK